MGLDVKTVDHQGIPVIELEGRMSGADTARVSQAIQEQLAQPADKAVVDLQKVSFVDSGGLGVFVNCWKNYREQGNELLFLIPQGQIYEIFCFANLDKTFHIIDTLEKLG